MAVHACGDDSADTALTPDRALTADTPLSDLRSDTDDGLTVLPGSIGGSGRPTPVGAMAVGVGAMGRRGDTTPIPAPMLALPGLVTLYEVAIGV